MDNIWVDKDSRVAFMNYFDKECINKDECDINPEDQELNLFYKFNDYCKDRIQFLNITSYDYILIAGCSQDEVVIPIINSMMHKEKVGILVVSLDIMSVMIMAFIFSKLKNINDEFKDKMDNLRV
jgi:hypothetical protein